MGQPAARLTDMHVCPLVTGLVPHVGGPIAGPCEPTVLIGGMPAARISDMAVCIGPPDVIALGASTVLIGGMPAARLGDNCAHGGVIVSGCPTVLIGDAGAEGGADDDDSMLAPPPAFDLAEASGFLSEILEAAGDVVDFIQKVSDDEGLSKVSDAITFAKTTVDAVHGILTGSTDWAGSARIVAKTFADAAVDVGIDGLFDAETPVVEDAGVEAGIEVGAAIGSIFPGPGTVIGAVVGGVVGFGLAAYGCYELKKASEDIAHKEIDAGIDYITEAPPEPPAPPPAPDGGGAVMAVGSDALDYILP